MDRPDQFIYSLEETVELDRSMYISRAADFLRSCIYV